MCVHAVKFHSFPLLRGQSDPNICKDKIAMPTENINARQGNVSISQNT